MVIETFRVFIFVRWTIHVPPFLHLYIDVALLAFKDTFCLFLPVIARIRCFLACFGLPCYFAGIVTSFLFSLSILCKCFVF
jgi:hypothetical protein